MSHDIVAAIAAGAGECALVTVIETKGSVPRHAGSKMLVTDTLLGTVGGGRVEARAIEAARECIRARRSVSLSVEMQGTEAIGEAMICGGTSTMLVEYVTDAAPYRTAVESLERGQRILMVKSMLGGDAALPLSVGIALFDENGPRPVGTPPPATTVPVDRHVVARALRTGKPVLAREERVFYDPLFPREKLLVIGSGYVGQAVAAIAQKLDFSVTVADDRQEVISAAHFPPAVITLVGGYAEMVERFAFDHATYVVIVTRGHGFDLECIRAVLKKPYRYAGVIGSERKIKLLLKQLTDDGFAREKLDALHAPIGLDIEAETPEEIAVAIAAELVSVRKRPA
jgi:xanthine dehydrogenase accessory factor